MDLNSQANGDTTVAIIETPTCEPTTSTKDSKFMTIGDYRSALASEIPKEWTEINPWRLKWALFHGAGLFATMYALIALDLPWYVKVVLGLLAGTFSGSFGFVGHEILHGSVVRNALLQDVLGFITFAPFLIAPTFWRYWHNRLHHGKTQQLIWDPDAYPTMRLFKHSKFLNNMYRFTPGSKHLRSIFYFTFWFSLNAILAQTYFRFRNKIAESMNHTRVTIEFTSQVALMGLFAWSIGPQNWFYCIFLPFLMQNYFVMSYISTNHNLSPLTSVNDPLLNSLSVTNPRWMEVLHLNFGYHVEHHLYPNMSGVHTPKVARLLKAKWPTRYQIMPKWKALVMLYKTPRIYKNSRELINPETSETALTLGAENLV